MKSHLTRLALAAIAAAAMNGLSPLTAQTAQARKPVVVQPPAVPNGSNWSRAPFPSARQFDDVRAPDGQAVDKGLPPNTAATDPEPDPLPLPRVAVFQPAGPAGDPGLLPTGRPTVALSAGLDATNVVADVRNAGYEMRDAVVADIGSRWMATENALRNLRGTMREMSAQGRTQFKAGQEEIDDLDRELRMSLRDARYASAEQWPDARTRLAAAYEAYAAAVARIDALAGFAPAQR